MTDEIVLSVRVPRELAERARDVAVARDETMSQVVRRSLREYVECHAVASQQKNAA